jgi:hypothetical protein
MNMSFSMTTEKVLNKTKTITRRLGWRWLVEAVKRGEHPILQPVVKGQGIPKGGHVEKINGPIRVECAVFEPIGWLTNPRYYSPQLARSEVNAEGFPNLTPAEFVAMFCKHNGCTPNTQITRIQFSYV